GLRDVRVALGVVVGMLLAGFLIPLASREPKATNVASGQRGSTASARGATGSGGAAASAGPGSATDAGGGATPAGAAVAGGGSAGAAGAAGGPAANVEKTASDQGVTPDGITLGVALVNLDYLSRTGVAASNGTVADRTKVWQALVDDANNRGGAAGRKIQLAVRDFDPLSASSGADMCRALAEDEQIFSVITDVGIAE